MKRKGMNGKSGKKGRPPLPVALKKDRYIRIRVSQRELEEIKGIAKAQGTTVTGLLRGKALEDEEER